MKKYILILFLILFAVAISGWIVYPYVHNTKSSVHLFYIVVYALLGIEVIFFSLLRPPTNAGVKTRNILIFISAAAMAWTAFNDVFWYMTWGFSQQEIFWGTNDGYHVHLIFNAWKEQSPYVFALLIPSLLLIIGIILATGEKKKEVSS